MGCSLRQWSHQSAIFSEGVWTITGCPRRLRSFIKLSFASYRSLLIPDSLLYAQVSTPRRVMAKVCERDCSTSCHKCDKRRENMKFHGDSKCLYTTLIPLNYLQSALHHIISSHSNEVFSYTKLILYFSYTNTSHNRYTQPPLCSRRYTSPLGSSLSRLKPLVKSRP